MKLITTAMFVSVLAFSTVACAKEEPKKATPVATAPAAIAVPATTETDGGPGKGEMKEVCTPVKDKAGKEVKNKDGSVKETCKKIKVRKKVEGTTVPEPAKKK